jgi:hypothetical protein
MILFRRKDDDPYGIPVATRFAPPVTLPAVSNVILAVADDGSWMIVVLRVATINQVPDVDARR